MKYWLALVVVLAMASPSEACFLSKMFSAPKAPVRRTVRAVAKPVRKVSIPVRKVTVRVVSKSARTCSGNCR